MIYDRAEVDFKYQIDAKLASMRKRCQKFQKGFPLEVLRKL